MSAASYVDPKERLLVFDSKYISITVSSCAIFKFISCRHTIKKRRTRGFLALFHLLPSRLRDISCGFYLLSLTFVTIRHVHEAKKDKPKMYREVNKHTWVAPWLVFARKWELFFISRFCIIERIIILQMIKAHVCWKGFSKNCEHSPKYSFSKIARASDAFGRLRGFCCIIFWHNGKNTSRVW